MSDYELTEEYQKKLESFLTDIPALGGGKLSSMKPGSKTLTPPFTKKQATELAGVLEEGAFQRYTGYTHRGLLEKWSDPANRTTTCNEFCSKCANAMGYVAEDKNDGVGRFDIADYLTRMGKGHCWVRADSGLAPEYGDIFRLFSPSKDQNGVATNHMGVALYFNDGAFYTVESGQGGPSNGFDAIERKMRSWPVPGMQGWVSMRALLATGKRVEYWQGGWWDVKIGKTEQWYYYFGSDGRVLCSSEKPAVLTAPPAEGPMVTKGICTKKPRAYNTLQLVWHSRNALDVNEELQLAIEESKKRKFVMVGKTASGAKITATRMMITGLL